MSPWDSGALGSAWLRLSDAVTKLDDAATLLTFAEKQRAEAVLLSLKIRTVQGRLRVPQLTGGVGRDE